MKNKIFTKAMLLGGAILLGATVCSVTANAAGRQAQQGSILGQQGGTFSGQGNMQQGMGSENVTYATEAGEIVYSSMTSSAASLSENTSGATTYTMTDTDNQVKITESGTYIVTGSCSDGNITVKKGTTGVVLILKDLTLSSSTGAPVSINKTSQAKVVISGTVTLTDAEDPTDESSSDSDTADAFDGAAIKIKDGADAYITGNGKLVINASSCKNGIKIGDDSSTVCIIDGPAIAISAANDGINAGYDVSILSGTVTVSAGDDGIHADRILTIGGGSPTVRINKSYEGLEGSVVNIIDGNISVTASDDAINAANSDDTYASELVYSINVLGGSTTVKCSGDGLDSNGNINLIEGSLSIQSGSTGGEAGLDYVNSLYISDSFNLENASGISYDGAMGGMMGDMNMMQDGQSANGQAQDRQQANGQMQDEQMLQGQNMNPQANNEQNANGRNANQPNSSIGGQNRLQQGQAGQFGGQPGMQGNTSQAQFGGGQPNMQGGMMGGMQSMGSAGRR